MFRRDRLKCVEIGKQLRPTEVLETIRTCATAHHFRSERFKCLRRAPRR
jgi:hypothetical protein